MTDPDTERNWRESLAGKTADALHVELLQCASEGRLSRVETLLEHDDIDLRRDKCLVLVMAARKGHEDVMRLLFEHGATPADTEGDAMRQAAIEGRTGAMALLFRAENENGQGVDLENPLGWACVHGHTEAAQLLIDHGADPAHVMPFAAEKGDVKTVEMLLKNGADPDHKGQRGLSSPEIAEKHQDAALLDVFNRWARRADKLDIPASEFTGASLATLRALRDEHGNDGFMRAAKSGHFDLVIEAAGRDGGDVLTRDDLARRNADGHGLIDILGARGELVQLFDERLWSGRPNALRDFASKGVPRIYRAQIDLEKTLNEIARHKLRERGKKLHKLHR